MAKKNVNSSLDDMRKAFWAFASSSTENLSSKNNLLLFYAGECGLKALYMWKNKLKCTGDCDGNFFTHNLNSFWSNVPFKELRIPASRFKLPAQFRLGMESSCSGESVVQHEILRIHEAWRYHVRVHPDDEKEIVKQLRDLVQMLKDIIGMTKERSQ